MAAFWTLLGVFVGIAGKYVVDLKLAKKNKLREEKLKWAVEFLAAASQLAQAVTAQSDWQLELRNTIASETGEQSADQRTARLNRSKEEQTRVRSAWAEAYRANSAVRLLMPAATESAAGYLDLCGAAPDPTERGRDGAEARKEIEATLRDEVYG